MERLSSDFKFLRQIIFLDECIVHVAGIDSKQGTRIWDSES